MIVSVCPHRNSDHCLFGHTTPNNRYHHIQIHCCLFKKVLSCEEENVKDIGGIWQVKPKPGILMIARPDVRPNSGYGRAALYTWSNTDPCPLACPFIIWSLWKSTGDRHPPLDTLKHFSKSTNCPILSVLKTKMAKPSTWDIISQGLSSPPLAFNTGQESSCFFPRWKFLLCFFWLHLIPEHSNRFRLDL